MANTTSQRVPVAVKPSGAKYMKSRVRQEGESLKACARRLAEKGDELASNWLHNKFLANPRKPPAGIGSTYKRSQPVRR